MKNIVHCLKKHITLAVGIGLLLSCPVRLWAADSDPVSFLAKPERVDMVAVDLPTFSEEVSPFDFHLDPWGLIYATNAARYGGGAVEEGATLCFRNQGGEYDFSSSSDKLTVTNRSTVPVKVIVKVRLEQVEDAHMIAEKSFDDEECSVWLAIVDDRGNLQPISEEGETTLVTEMSAAPSGAYTYRFDEETQTYQYELTDVSDGSDVSEGSDRSEEGMFDTYSFGLTGACNPNGDWSDADAHIVVKVTWDVEPLLSSEPRGEETEETEKTDRTEETEKTEGEGTDSTDTPILPTEGTSDGEDGGTRVSSESKEQTHEEQYLVEQYPTEQYFEQEETRENDNEGQQDSEAEH